MKKTLLFIFISFFLVKAAYPQAYNDTDSMTVYGVTNEKLKEIPHVKKLILAGVSVEDSLDFSHNPELVYVKIDNQNQSYRSQFRVLDFSQCHKLEEVYCAFGVLEKLYISAQVQMKTLYCPMNILTFENMPFNPPDSPIIDNYVAVQQGCYKPLPPSSSETSPFDYQGDYQVGDIIDLSKYREYFTIKWYLFNEAEQGNIQFYNIEEVEPGKFKVPPYAVGDYLVASITASAAFGSYNPFFGYRVSGGTVGVNPQAKETPVKIKSTVVDTNSGLEIETGSRGAASLYTLSGKRAGCFVLNEGENYLAMSMGRGLYLLNVSLESGDSATMKIAVK